MSTSARRGIQPRAYLSTAATCGDCVFTNRSIEFRRFVPDIWDFLPYSPSDSINGRDVSYAK